MRHERLAPVEWIPWECAAKDDGSVENLSERRCARRARRLRADIANDAPRVRDRAKCRSPRGARRGVPG
ncbi:hypothetical protein GLE_5089 [Lysobacter enzymogenes]|uniref:Uncharacterized protein n=1 Tax=Lysobacter enzymogenes TaxID=69 RepID=A0A0S2DPC7_LYSEN|nr:hypothetical protein GLE_5089 [Lysobacter enzymogenes]